MPFVLTATMTSEEAHKTIEFFLQHEDLIAENIDLYGELKPLFREIMEREPKLPKEIPVLTEEVNSDNNC